MLVNFGDIADGVLVNAIWATMSVVLRSQRSRGTRDDLSVVGWADIDRLTRQGLAGARLELPELSEADAAQLESGLKRDEVHAALQALLAARLTDAPETDSARARSAVRLALRDVRYAQEIGDHYDRQISGFVARLKEHVGLTGLAQIRSEAYNSRIVAVLNRIELQVAALSHADRGGQAEARFLDGYLWHVRDVHGKLEPPDFERRRKVPVEKIYVNASIHSYAARDIGVGHMKVTDLAENIDRTVLLGDPGGGKTTAANVTAYLIAKLRAGKIPFLVTLRDYAAMDPPERSVVRHIEHTLSTKYQCTAPDGLVDRLLRTGRAVVIFDGLDELLNTYRRRDISSRVEQFCIEYPLTLVLVTSRVVGYDEARLDESQFTVYRLGGFEGGEVAEYARKWFAAQDSYLPTAARAEAEAFLAESASASDLRSNPLLLSLMCILYRGEGSLPRDRAGIYARCAELLLRKWDEMRRIHREVRDGHLIEPAIWHLAWWMFAREDPLVAVTERELVNEITNFLRNRGFDSVEQARATAQEFAESCSGRMWVLSDTGTTADGEKLYSFTHRTFLEYFTAVRLATVSDTPEDLAQAVADRLRKGEWEVVSQLAIQIKDRTSDRGADRVYDALIQSDATASEDQGRILCFLARFLEIVEPSPASVRQLTRAVLEHLFDGGTNRVSSNPLRDLLSYSVRHDELVADELSNCVTAMIASGDAASRERGLGLILELPWLGRVSPSSFWGRWARDQARLHGSEIAAEAARNSWFMITGLYSGSISVEQALTMTSDFGPLLNGADNHFSDVPIVPYSQHLVGVLLSDKFTATEDRMRAIDDLGAIGRHLLGQPAQSWFHPGQPIAASRASHVGLVAQTPYRIPPGLDEVSGLGLAALMCISAEIGAASEHDLIRSGLLQLPMPSKFRPLFQEWADGQVSFC